VGEALVRDSLLDVENRITAGERRVRVERLE